MNATVAFVGAGPTTIYTLHALMGAAQRRFRIVIYEEQDVAGRGTPYRPGWNDPAMLSNIASIEIPALENTLVDWLLAQPAERLEKMGVDPNQIDDRSFYPRLALGEYLHDQFDAIIEHGRDSGFEIELRTRCRVVDAEPDGSGFLLAIRSDGRQTRQERCDYLVIATGHQWPEEPEVRPGYFLSPWPASVLDRIGPCSVGIRGTSLSAIDAAVVLAIRFGEFVEDGSKLAYRPAPGSDAFRLTMMSRKGLLPEADFYHPIPYEPLSICTPGAVEAVIDAGVDCLLDKAFELFKRELAETDPAYAQHVGLAAIDLEGFRDGYFADRMRCDPFEWARRNLAEAVANYETETTVPWRYAILRMHEVLAPIVPHLDRTDFERFNRYLKPVFVDDYATVPHESIKRMLALHEAAKLDLVALGEHYRIDSRGENSGATVRLDGAEMHFPAFVEATGQHPLGIEEFPFPTLRREGIVEDAGGDGANRSERGIVVDDHFHPVSDGHSAGRLFCVSLPFILGRHPFAQGITSSRELGDVVGKELAAALDHQ